MSGDTIVNELILAESDFPVQGVLGSLVFFGFVGLVYLVPTIVAGVRKVPNAGSVIVLNLLLGWTLIGWVVALVMALQGAGKPPAS